ncbi:glycoside hydrolase family 18 protein [Botrimarina mediterranea]|nr:glycoside hydrolase family 18 protein [Botrimarina mediterranea]
MTSFVRTLALFLALSALPAAAERVMVGYFATFGNLAVEQIPWDGLTHLSHCYLSLDAGGKVLATDAVPNGALTAEGRKNGVPVLVVVGGGNSVAGLEKATAAESSTKQLAADIVKVVADGKYDGVDLNWEFPRDAATSEGHARLLAELRRQLNAEAKRMQRKSPYLMTTSVSASPDFGQWIDAKRIVPLVDWLGVMAYDMADPWSLHAAHHAPLFPSSLDPEREKRSVATATRYWERQRGVPKDKLVVGVPFYGRSMPVAKPFEQLDPEQRRRHQVMAFSAVRKLVDEGWRAEWDNESRAPWLSSPEPPNEPNAESDAPLRTVDENVYDGPVLISYDDRNSVHGKAVWANEQGYRGMYFWAIHQDRMPDGRHWLIDAANNAWPKE